MLPNNKNWYNSVPRWNSALFLLLVKKLLCTKQNGEISPGESHYLLCAFLLLRGGSTLWGGQNIFPMWRNYPTAVPEMISWTSSFRKCHQQLSEARFWTGKVKSLSLSPAPSLLLGNLQKFTDNKSSPAFCISLTTICNFHLWCWLPKHSKYFLA